MSVSLYQSNVNRVQGQIADLRTKVSRELSKKATLTGDISRIQRSVTKNTPPSVAQSKFREITRKQNEIAKIEQRIVEHERKSATKGSECTRYQKSLDNALAAEARKRERAERERQRRLEEDLRRTQAATAKLNKQGSITGSPFIGGPVSFWGGETQAAGKKSKSDKAPSKPWSDTLRKIEELRAIREDSKNKGQIIGWTVACHQAGVEPRTVKNYDPELRTRWYDKDF